MPIDHQNQPHSPVLLNEVLAYLDPKPGESYLDLTAGYGGHAAAVLKLTESPEKALLVDRDREAIEYLEAKFAQARIIHSDFLAAAQELAAEGKKFDLILADLGIASPHIDKPERGFSFARSGPLDMRMDQRQPLSAETLVNQADEAELVQVISRYGEEPRARRIAAAIIASRPIKNTAELAEVIARAVGRNFRRNKIHPATKTFQALRIAVNDELGQLQASLPLMCELLAPGGRLAVISFHSLEDRLVKRYFGEIAGDRYDATARPLTKKPVTASPQEIDINPRARSAKLRAVAKIKTERIN